MTPPDDHLKAVSTMLKLSTARNRELAALLTESVEYVSLAFGAYAAQSKNSHGIRYTDAMRNWLERVSGLDFQEQLDDPTFDTD